jgi:Domain of unknown function (DUF3291)
MHLAELNIARLHKPLDDPDNREFVASLDAINLLAESSVGFVWRLKDESGQSSSYVQVYDDPLLIVNLSVWTSTEALRHFVYRSGHSAYLRRKRDWFAPADGEQFVCWWIREGTTPDPLDAKRRLDTMRTDGPSIEGFLLSDPFQPPAT